MTGKSQMKLSSSLLIRHLVHQHNRWVVAISVAYTSGRLIFTSSIWACPGVWPTLAFQHQEVSRNVSETQLSPCSFPLAFLKEKICFRITYSNLFKYEKLREGYYIKFLREYLFTCIHYRESQKLWKIWIHNATIKRKLSLICWCVFLHSFLLM